MEKWTAHDGEGIPVDGDVVVQIRQRDGWESLISGRPAKFWNKNNNCWIHSNHHRLRLYDIVAYRLVEAP